MILIVLDFDHTVVDGNTDVKVPLSLEPHDVTYNNKVGWTEYMKLIFEECHKQGITQNDMAAFLKEMQLTPGMAELFAWIKRNKGQIKVIIASDSNTWFIDVLLRHFGIDDVIDDVNSNPAHWNGDLLEISRYTTNDFCKLCPINMCKSAIVSNFLSTWPDITHTVYVGDGGNDLCPVLNLGAGDLACPREGYKLCDLLASRSFSCKVKSWTDASSLVESIAAVLNS